VTARHKADEEKEDDNAENAAAEVDALATKPLLESINRFFGRKANFLSGDHL
jgi:hypothetical protein